MKVQVKEAEPSGKRPTCSVNLIKLAAFFISFVLLSCSKGGSPAPPAPLPTPSPAPGSPTVYVTGDSLVYNNRSRLPVYWKNGVVKVLPTTGYSIATAIAIKDSNVFIANGAPSITTTETYWKNGVAINLIDPALVYTTTSCYAITTSGNDVYVAGDALERANQKQVPIYWKNTTPVAVQMPTISNPASLCRGIAVSGSDVYVAGTTMPNIPNFAGRVATYWKNGVPNYLFFDDPYKISAATGIAISGSDIYVIGNSLDNGYYIDDSTEATVWKNGKPKALSPKVKSVANGLCIVGSDVYVAGTIYGSDRIPKAVYWKNGTMTVLDNSYSEAKGITVYGNDVYVAGTHDVADATYWKNGVAVRLGTGHGWSIAVTK